MNVEQRKRIEREVIEAAVKQIVASGATIAIDNGEDRPVKQSSDVAAIMAGIMQTDEEHLLVHRAGRALSSVYLVYGNDGYDVICDYSVSLEDLLTDAHKVADKYG